MAATTLQQYEHALIAQGGHAASTVAQTAMGLIYESFQMQAAILAYTDVFAIGGTWRSVLCRSLFS